MRATEGPRLALGEIQSLSCFICAQGLEKEKERRWIKKGRRKEKKTTTTIDTICQICCLFRFSFWNCTLSDSIPKSRNILWVGGFFFGGGEDLMWP